MYYVGDPMRNFLFLLTILPADSNLSWKPQTVWNQSCSVANSLAPTSISLLHSGSETPHTNISSKLESVLLTKHNKSAIELIVT